MPPFEFGACRLNGGNGGSGQEASRRQANHSWTRQLVQNRDRINTMVRDLCTDFRQMWTALKDFLILEYNIYHIYATQTPGWQPPHPPDIRRHSQEARESQSNQTGQLMQDRMNEDLRQLWAAFHELQRFRDERLARMDHNICSYISSVTPKWQPPYPPPEFPSNVAVDALEDSRFQPSQNQTNHLLQRQDQVLDDLQQLQTDIDALKSSIVLGVFKLKQNLSSCPSIHIECDHIDPPPGWIPFFPLPEQ